MIQKSHSWTRKDENFNSKKDIIDEEENSYVRSVLKWKDSFCHIGKNNVNLSALNFELDIKSL